VGAVAEQWLLLAVPLGRGGVLVFFEGFVFSKRKWGIAVGGEGARVNFLQTKMAVGTPILKAATFALSNEREV
jgi:hypothetical protein